ncbi:MAG: DUF6915 family protein [Candidatus Methanospirareceae archaeon]
MPNLREHYKHDVKRFGKAIADRYKFIHRILDSAQPALQRWHRKLYHDERTVKLIEQLFGPIAAEVAREHIRLDRETTRLKNLKRKNKSDGNK